MTKFTNQRYNYSGWRQEMTTLMMVSLRLLVWTRETGPVRAVAGVAYAEGPAVCCLGRGEEGWQADDLLQVLQNEV